MRCLNRYILARYRRERCVYENRLNTEGFLRSDSSDSNVTVETVLRSEGSSSPKNQVLCISAEPGYGKDFLAKRICVLDYDCAYENQLTTSMWFDPFLVQTGGRMPFIIQEDDVKQYLRKKADGTVTNGNALCCICAESIMRVLRHGDEYQDLECRRLLRYSTLFHMLLESLQKALVYGNLFVLFEKNSLPPHSAEFDAVLSADLSAAGSREARKNLLVFLLDSAEDNPLRWAAYHVVLTPLTKQEVLDHVDFCTGGSEHIIQEFEALFTSIPACTIPDCLLFISSTHLGPGLSDEGSENIQKAETAADLYRDCITKAVQDRFPSDKADEMLRKLRRYAWSTYYDDEPDIRLLDGIEKQLMYMEGKRNHLLKRDWDFRFEGCREYLVAEMIDEKLLGGTERDEDRALLEKANRNIRARLLEIAIRHYKLQRGKEGDVQSSQVFQRLWTAILHQGTAVSFADMEFLNRFLISLLALDAFPNIDWYLESYLRQAVLQMEVRGFDNRLFSLYAEVNRKAQSFRFNKRLKEIYLKKLNSQFPVPDEEAWRKKDRFIRRYLFYAGKHSEIDLNILNGLYDETLSDHVKCHLLRAIRDNYFDGKNKHTFREQTERMMEYGHASDSQILLLNASVLHFLLMDVPFDSEPFKKAMLQNLEDPQYWVRAHSADVMAYLEDISIPQKLADALAWEMEREEDGYIRLRVINHMAEAICEFYYFRQRQGRPCSENAADLQEKAVMSMLRLIRHQNLMQQWERMTVMAAYATIAESVRYLLQKDYRARPEFFDIHVGDGQEQWGQNAALVEEALKMAAARLDHQEIEAILHNFQNVLDDIAREEIDDSPSRQQLISEDERKAKIYETEKKSHLEDGKDVCNVTNNFYGNIGSVVQGDHAVVNQDSFVQDSSEAMKLFLQMEATLKEHCTQAQLAEADPVLAEVRDAAGGRMVTSEEQKSWPGRLLTALAVGADILTVAQASWWPSVNEFLQKSMAVLIR